MTKVLPLLRKIIEGNNISLKEATQLFKTIFLYDKKGYYFTAAFSAIHAKGETAEELAGIVNSLRELSPTAPNIQNVTDLSGTGGAKFKTINVSTIASFIVASAGIKVAKASYYSVTGKFGSADLLKSLGIDIQKINTLEKLKRILQQTGLVFYYAPFLSPKLKNRGELFKKVFIEEGLKVKSPFHLTTNAFSIVPIKQRIYGIYNPKYLKTIATMFQILGFKRTLTFTSEYEADELLNSGKNFVILQEGNKLKELTLTSKDFALPEVSPSDIKFISKEHSEQIALDILKGKNTGPYAQLVWMNAAASFYVNGMVNSFRNGVELARKLCLEKRAYKKYRGIKEFYTKI